MAQDPEGARLLCYCFGETESVIRSELAVHGRTAVVDRIREHIAARGARVISEILETYCIGDVIAAVKRIERTVLAARDD